MTANWYEVEIPTMELLGRVIGNNGHNIRTIIGESKMWGIEVKLLTSPYNRILIKRGEKHSKFIIAVIKTILNSVKISPISILQTFKKMDNFKISQ